MDPVLHPSDPVVTKTDHALSKKRYHCDTCLKQFDIYSTYYSHKTSHNPKSIQCRSCQQVFPTTSKLYKHHYHSHSSVPTDTHIDKVQQYTTDIRTDNIQRDMKTRSKLSTRILDL